jgi:hypothetical protein
MCKIKFEIVEAPPIGGAFSYHVFSLYGSMVLQHLYACRNMAFRLTFENIKNSYYENDPVIFDGTVAVFYLQ